MKRSTWLRRTCLLLATAGALVMPQPVMANPIVPFTLTFEREGLDLDTGTIVPIEIRTLAVNPADPQPDLVLGYNSERTVCAVVFQNRMNGVQIAFLDGVAFNLVDSADLAGLSFTAAMIDAPFETGDSVVRHVVGGRAVDRSAASTSQVALSNDRTL